MASELKVLITGDGTKLRKELVKSASEINKLEQQTKKAEKQFKDLGKSVTNVRKDFSGMINSIKSGDLTGIFDGVLSSGGNVKEMFGNLTSSAMKLINPWTLAAAAIAGATYAFVNYNIEMEKTLQRTEQFTGLSGDALMSLRNGIKSTANTYGKEFNDVLSSVDGMMSQFGIDGESALNIINKGFQGGCDDGGKLFDLIGKYSGAFNDAGISASELVAIIGNTRSGIFNEQGMEIISKAAMKIREFSDNTAKALDSIGISSTQMQQDLQSGQITTMQAIQQVSEKLKSLPKQSQEVGKVMKEVFGEQAAKGGYELVTALADVETNLDNIAEQTGEVGKAMKQLQEANREFENALSSLFAISDGGFSTMTTKLKAEVYGAVARCINGFIDWYNKSMMVRYGIQLIALQFKNAWEIIKAILKLFIGSIKGLGEAIEGVLTLDWEKVKSGWKSGIENILKTVATGFENIKNNVVHVFDETLNGEIKKIEVPVEVNATTNKNNTTSNNKTNDDKKEDPKKTSNKTSNNKTDKQEKIKTQIEIDRENLQNVQKQLKQAIEDFNNGLISKDDLNRITEDVNTYFKDNNIKANVEIEYNTDENGFEKATEKKPIKLQTELEINRDKLKDIQSTISQLQDDFNNKLIDAEYADSEIDKINEKLKELGLNTKFELIIDANNAGEILDDTALKTKQLAEAQEKAKEIADKNKQGYDAMASTFGNLGNAIGGTAGKFMEMAGQSISAISQIIPQIVSLVSAKEAEALASGTASAAAMPFPASIAAIASIIATITGLFASFAGSFASGGIIGGTTTIGDLNLARVNKGEMILNGTQQSRLFKMLNGSGYYTNDSNNQVTFKIHGKELVGVIGNYTKRTSKAL